MTTKTALRAEDFLPIFESRDGWCELVDGEVVEVSPGMFPHNRIRDRLLRVLADFVERHALGIVISEQPFQLAASTVRFPDVAFVTAGRALPPKGFPQDAPDLAVEIISPSNTLREMERKVSDYFAAGSKRVWLIYPEEREVYIHGASGVARKSGDNLLEDAELLPGFSATVASIFE